MGEMMGIAGAWMALWIVLGVAMLVTGGVVTARILTTRRPAGPPPVPAKEPPDVAEARAALRLRYANGEVSREDYLQGKVELDD
jgi:putative membrane protein